MVCCAWAGPIQQTKPLPHQTGANVPEQRGETCLVGFDLVTLGDALVGAVVEPEDVVRQGLPAISLVVEMHLVDSFQFLEPPRVSNNLRRVWFLPLVG